MSDDVPFRRNPPFCICHEIRKEELSFYLFGRQSTTQVRYHRLTQASHELARKWAFCTGRGRGRNKSVKTLWVKRPLFQQGKNERNTVCFWAWGRSQVFREDVGFSSSSKDMGCPGTLSYHLTLYPNDQQNANNKRDTNQISSST